MSAAQTLSPLPHADVEGIPDLVARLRARFDTGVTRPLEWRLAQLAKLEALLRDNEKAFADALHADLRKPDIEGFLMDIGIVASDIAYMRKKLKSWMKPERVPTPLALQPGKSYLVREPLGVVLIIAPWNYPVQLVISPLAAAFAAGNVAVVKPSELTPHTSALLAKVLAANFDSDVVACVEGAVTETTALLAERFDHILYTGNGRVARIVMQAAAKHLTPVTLELGGKSPCIIDSDCDLETSARRIAWGKFVNSGQTCIAPDYVLVHRSREEELVKLLAKNIREFYGDDPQQSPDFARVVSEQHVDRLAKLLESGTVAAGGQVDRSDRYVAPTILRNVSPESPAMQDEIFGPILPILPVDDVEEAIRFVNGREKPLALYLFTSRPEIEDRVLSQTSAGGVSVNAVSMHAGNPNLPFGGVGESGIGSYHGRFGFETFSHRKAVLKKSTRIDPKMMYPPYTKLKKALIKRFALMADAAAGRRRTLGRYLLFQAPGWIVAALLATLAVEWGLASTAVAWGCVALLVAKDAVLYRFVRRSYDREGPTHGHVGEQGLAEGPIDPEGWVQIGAESWRARLAPGAPPIAAGAETRIVAVEGLLLRVVANEARRNEKTE